MGGMDLAFDATVAFDEYIALPETTAPCEFVAGVAAVTPQPSPLHQMVLLALGRVLADAAPADLRVVGPVDWVLARAPLHVRQPDLAVITRAQVDAPRLESPPVLAVEILSPGSRERDLVVKARVYAEAGLPWYWVVDPAEPALLVLRNDGGSFRRHARASGDRVLRLDEPFPVELRPAQLTA